MANTSLTDPNEEDTTKKPLFGTSPDLYSNLNPGNDPVTAAAYKTVGSQISGDAYDPYKTAANEALQTSAKNLRAQTASTSAPNLGQGAATAAQQGTEQNIMSQLSTTQVSEQQGEEQMKNQGIANYNTLGNLALANKSQTFTENQQAYSDAIAAKDPNAAAAAYSKMYPGQTLDTTQLQKDIANTNTLTGQQINAGSLGLTSTQFQGVSQMVNSGATLDQINSAYGTNLTQDQYNSMAAMYQSTLGTSNTNLAGLQQKLGSDKYNAIQNMVNTGATTDQINAQYGAGTLTQDQYNSMKAVAGTTFQSATMALNQKIQSDTVYLQQQGIDINKATLEGYTDASGNHVMGSAEIAAQSFGLQTKTVQDTENALYGTTINGQWVAGSLQNMSDAQKNQAASLYGYTDPVSGQHVAGTLEIANDSNAIQKQGMDNATAALKGYIDSNGNYVMGSAGIAAQNAGLQVDSLKGYTDANGNHVDGSLSLAQKQFGLQSSTLDLQTKEVMGYTDASGYHAGSIANADATTQNQMYGMYGYALDANGNRVAVGSPNAVDGTTVAGSMSLQADQVDIQKQGLTLQTAQLEGYNKTNADGTTTHVDGSLENAAATLDLSSKSYQDQHTQLFGGWDPTANDGQGAWVNGSISNLDQTQQNQAYSLYGYALDKSGNKVAIGDPSAVAGSTVQGSLSIQYANATASQEQARAATNSTNQATASAAYWDTSKEVETYAQTHLDASTDIEKTVNDPEYVSIMQKWYTQQTGKQPPAGGMTDPTFQKWAQDELAAAQDKRLTNPLDASIYAIQSSTTLSDSEKAQYTAIFKELPSGTTFSVGKDGKLVAYAAQDPNSPGTFGGGQPVTSIDASANPKESTFASNGAQWMGESSTTALSAGQAVTISGANASIQGSNVVVPQGNYYAIDATHLQSATPDSSGNYKVYDTTGKTNPVTTTNSPAQNTANTAGLSTGSTAATPGGGSGGMNPVLSGLESLSTGGLVGNNKVGGDNTVVGALASGGITALANWLFG